MVSNRVLILGAALLALTNARGVSITVGQPATSENAFPFGGNVVFGGTATRYQQAYAASDFAGLGAIAITGIDFLQGEGELAPNTCSFYFSTITAGIDALSDSNFNSNLGPDNTLFTSTNLSGLAPATLTIRGGSFSYNPATGNLLLDIIVSPGGNGAWGGSYAENTNAPGVFSRYQNFGLGTTGYGLITEFDYTVVPEPSTMALASAGLVGATIVWRRKLRAPAIGKYQADGISSSLRE